MAQRKPYNSNTAYGRRKIREQSQQYYENLPPEDQKNWNSAKFLILLIIVIVVLAIGFCTGNEKGAMKWLSH